MSNGKHSDTGSNIKRAERTAPLREVLHDGAAEIQQTLGHMAHEGRGAIGQMVHEGRSRVDHLIEEGQTRVDGWRSDLGRMVQRRPVQSLLVVAGIGAVLGMMLRGRRSA